MKGRWPAAMLLLALLAAPVAAEERFNIVVLDICSARADHFGFSGYARPTTPNLDHLAKDAAVFENALAQSSWCLPNYATLLTGHRPSVHGENSNEATRGLPQFEVTVGERLHEAGYRAAGFTGGIYFMPVWGLQRGFDRFSNRFSTTTTHAPARFADMVPDIMDWIVTESSRPFFLYATVDDLHVPYQSDDSERFDPGYEGLLHDTTTLNMLLYRAYNGEKTDLSRARQAQALHADPRHLRHLIAHYDSALVSADEAIATFIDRLKQKGILDQTILIITADHGEMLGEKGLLGHTEGLYEPVLHVPLMIRHPGLPATRGRRYSELVERIDLTPTLLDLGGASYADLELQGSSLVPLMGGRRTDSSRVAFAASKRNLADPVFGAAIDEWVARDQRWKLYWRLDGNRLELYDLLSDPQEMRDLAQQRPGVALRLSGELLRHMELSRPHAPGLPSGRKPWPLMEIEPAQH